MNTPLVVLALLLSASVGAELPASRRAAEQAWRAEGLQRATLAGIDAAYARPDVDLTRYDKVRLLPIDVTWHRDERKAPGSPHRLRPEDAQHIRDRLAAVVHEELVRELRAAGLAVVDSPGAGVLDVALAIVDRRVLAPDARTPGRVEVYAYSTGELRLVAELRDAQRGGVVLRLYDRERAVDLSRPERVTVADNTQDAQRAAREWAGGLRAALRGARR